MYDYMKALQKRFDRQEYPELEWPLLPKWMRLIIKRMC